MEIKGEMRSNKFILGFITLILALIIFVLFKSLCNTSWFSKFTFTNEINPLDIFSLITSLGVAIWLGYFITKKLTEDRFIKEFVISDICKIEEEVNFIERITTESDKLELQTIFDGLHKLKQKIERFEQTSRLIGIGNKDFTSVNKCHSKLFLITTNSDKDIIDFQNKRNEIEIVCSDFIIELRGIICSVNNK